jgi:hypothetical protein
MSDVTPKWAAMVEQEIADHANWCSPRCRAFLPDAYREARRRHSRETVQRQYDLCHIWR